MELKQPTNPATWTDQQKGESAAKVLAGQECSNCEFEHTCRYALVYGPCEFWKILDAERLFLETFSAEFRRAIDEEVIRKANEVFRD
jgi:hypothetical protein